MNETVQATAPRHSTSSGSSRDALLVAARRLFAERGIDAVSLREINRESGARNATALQYHFQDRDGVLRAVLRLHTSELSIMAHALMDGVDARGGPVDAREAVQVVGVPLLGQLRTWEGREFLQVAAQLISRAVSTPGPDDPLRILVDDDSGSLSRWAQLIGPLMAQGTPGRPLHQRFSVLRFAYTELGRRAREHERGRFDDLFGSHLIDLMTAIALAPPSVRTVELLKEFDAATSGQTLPE